MFYEKSVDSQRILYTASDFAKSSLLYLQETGTLAALKPHKSIRSGLLSYLFFVVLGGEGMLSYKGIEYKLKKGDCIFVDCKENYSHSTSSKLWKLQWIHFYGESMLGIYEKYSARGGKPVFRPDSTDKYIDILKNVYDIAFIDDYIRDMKLNEQIAKLLTLIMEMSWSPEKQADKKRGSNQLCSLVEIKDYIDSNWDKKISLDELAVRFFINKYYLLRIFKNQYGRSILNYIIEKRITHSKRMLRFTSDTVEKISYACGFEDPNYFSRKFKNIEGISPIEFRRIWVQEKAT